MLWSHRRRAKLFVAIAASLVVPVLFVIGFPLADNEAEPVADLLPLAEPAEVAAPDATVESAQYIAHSLRVKQPTVTVRAAPGPRAGVSAATSAQWAFLDANGQLASSPPAGQSVPALFPQTRVVPVQTRSTVDPNAYVLDTSHILFIASASLDADGKIDRACTHSTALAPEKSECCDEPADATADQSQKGGR